MSHVSRHTAVHAAARAHYQQSAFIASMHVLRQNSRNVAALFADILVMKLTPELLSTLGVATQAENLLISAQGDHLRRRRKHEALAIIEAIPRALTRMTYHGLRDNSTQTHTVVGEHKLGGLLAIKFKIAIQWYISQHHILGR